MHPALPLYEVLLADARSACPLSVTGEPAGQPPSLDVLNALPGARPQSGGGARIRFVPPDASDEPYELRAWRSGEIVTRAGNWHDAYNAMAWIAWPQTKRELNGLHHAHAAAEAAAGATARSTPRDVLTLFDEDGMIVACAEPALSELLAAFRWKELFWQQREAVARSMRFHVFGHALADKLRAPFRGLTAKVLVFAVDAVELRLPLVEQVAAMDARAAVWFREPAALASTRVLSPLPVLGIPGWHADNACGDYYDDTGQFRPGRRSRGVHSLA